jgi:pimeloyl-ACP methyl ester carboxylesterase
MHRAPRTPVLLALTLASAACAEPSPDAALAGSAAVPALERLEVASDGHPMTVWARIPEDPEAVVLLLHGRTWSSLPDFDLRVEGGSAGATLDPAGGTLSLMEALAAEAIAGYALDARGYGATPRDTTGWLNPDRMAEDVANVLRWISARHPAHPAPAVMGWSFGSTTAHLMAQRHPELVSGVALYGYWKDPSAVIAAQDEPAAPPRTATTDEGARSDFITEGTIAPRAVDAFVAAALSADPVRVDIRRIEEFNALSPDSLTVPTLILQGEYDPIAPAATQAALFGGLGTGHKAWVVLPGCDHAAHLEVCQDRFVRALVGFVKEVAGR